MTQMGPIPVQFPIEADSLEAAFGLFPEGIKAAVEKLNDRAKEMAREEASRIVVPVDSKLRKICPQVQEVNSE